MGALCFMLFIFLWWINHVRKAVHVTIFFRAKPGISVLFRENTEKTVCTVGVVYSDLFMVQLIKRSIEKDKREPFYNVTLLVYPSSTITGTIVR